MPPTKNSRRSLLRRAIVRSLKYTGAGAIGLLTLPLTVKYKGVRWLTPQQVQKIISQLLYEGDLERQGKDRCRLTPQGAVHVLPFVKQQLAKDGKVRILVFDIPEEERPRRDRFRRHIRLLGFKPHQRSVWVSKYRCEKWIGDVAIYHRVEDWVSLYIGTRVW